MREPTKEELSVESDWAPLRYDDELLAPPNQFPPPLVVPKPDLLNTHEMPWPAFEKLVVDLAQKLDGAFEARRYGRPGQAQHGLDVVGFFAEEMPSVYQAKRRQQFDADDFENAVKLYAEGRRPFDANRVVVAVASEVLDTAVTERLHKLRQDFPDFTIELWDRARISDLLRHQAQIVTRFFGLATRDAFCITEPTVELPVVEADSIAADAILRGPIAHLSLTDDVRHAEELMPNHPDEAAVIFGAVAYHLERQGFAPHATTVRERQARALAAAGQRDDEGDVRLALGWHRLAADDVMSVRVQLQAIQQWGTGVSDAFANRVRTLDLATALRTTYGISLEEVALAVDRLDQGDPNRADAFLILAEGSVVLGRPEIVAARQEVIESVAAGLPSDREGQLVAARLRMCVADCIGGWEPLAATARDTYPPDITALVVARSARHLNLVPNGPAAVGRWRDAIERACMEGLNGDAADWLYALRATRIENSLIEGDPNESHRNALVLKAAGTDQVIPEAFSSRERALDDVRDEKWPDAYEEGLRYLWRSVVVASWVDELEAHELLGGICAKAGRGRDAVDHYIAAGKSGRVEEFAKALRDEAVPLPISLVTPRPWERASAFRLASTRAELIIDDYAREWAAAAFREVDDHPFVAQPFSPDPWREAFCAFASLAELSTPEDAARFLELSAPLIPRDPGRYRQTDEDQVRALIGIARGHREHRDVALDQLLQAVVIDERMAKLVLSEGDWLLRLDADRVERALAPSADTSVYAAMALVYAGADTSPVVPLARTMRDRAMAPVVHPPGQMSFGTNLPFAAPLVLALTEQERVAFARHMVVRAQDEGDATHNRSDALAAIRAVSHHLPSDVRSELFDEMLSFAQGNSPASEEQFAFPGASDLLSRFTLNMGDAALGGYGLWAAATLAERAEQYVALDHAAGALLFQATELTLNCIAWSLLTVPPHLLRIPIEVLAAHPNVSLRSLAAVIWLRGDSYDDELGERLARDPSHQVRGALASGITSEARHQTARELLTADPRRSIRRVLRERLADDSAATSESS
jgi:hypothetical protein